MDASKCTSSKDVCTTFRVCLRSPTTMDNRAHDLHIVQTIEAETFQEHRKKSRVIFKEAQDTDRPHVYIQNFTMLDSNRCTTCSLILTDRSDIHNTVKLKLTLEIEDDLDEMSRTNQNRVILIDRYPILNKKHGTLIMNANFIKNCGDDEVCESALGTRAEMNLSKEGGDYVYYLGTEQINVTVSVENTGESAYDAFVEITHPAQVTYTGKLVLNHGGVIDCTATEPTMVKCNLGNPMENGVRHDLLLKFRAESSADSLNTMRFSIKTTTTSSDTKKQPAIDHDVTIIRAAELDVKGVAKPEQVYYGGTVIGASAMTSEVEIGTEVEHVYTVFNYGPYMVPNFDVLLRWPMELESDRRHGKYLLYLTEKPKITVADITTACKPVGEDPVDPLKLTMTRAQLLAATEAPVAAASRAKPSFAVRVPQKKSTESLPMPQSSTTTPKPAVTEDDDYNDYSDYESEPRATTVRTIYSRKIIHERNETFTEKHSRQRRDTTIPARPERIDDRTVNVVTMECGTNVRCVEFVCKVMNLKKHKNALISIKARLWNATFVEDYPRVDLVSISSSAEIHLDPGVNIRQNTSSDYAKAITKAYPDTSLYQRSPGIPWWAYFVAILLGILIVIFIVWCLYKYGFFNRHRPQDAEYTRVSLEEKPDTTTFILSEK